MESSALYFAILFIVDSLGIEESAEASSFIFITINLFWYAFLIMVLASIIKIADSLRHMTKILAEMRDDHYEIRQNLDKIERK